jgi:hypothetical protein
MQRMFPVFAAGALLFASSATALDFVDNGHAWTSAATQERRDMVILALKRGKLDSPAIFGRLDAQEVHECVTEFLSPPVDQEILAKPLFTVIGVCAETILSRPRTSRPR